MTAVIVASGQQPTAPQFGGGYAELDARRQALVNDWVARLVKTTGQKVEPGPFYDDFMVLSSKITFEAVTHALQRDPADRRLGREPRRRAVARRAGRDRQRRSHRRGRRSPVPDVRAPDSRRARDARAVATVQAWRRQPVFHKGYPTNYRGQGGMPSVQISIALDGRRADIDVDYRASSFPTSLFNGHLTSANSDVRAGNNYDRHVSRWTGFQKWWGGFFGTRQTRAEAPGASARRRHSDDASPRQEEHRRDGQRLPDRVAGRGRHRRVDGLRLGAIVRVPRPQQRQSRGLRLRPGAVSADDRP